MDENCLEDLLEAAEILDIRGLTGDRTGGETITRSDVISSSPESKVSTPEVNCNGKENELQEPEVSSPKMNRFDPPKPRNLVPDVSILPVLPTVPDASMVNLFSMLPQISDLSTAPSLLHRVNGFSSLAARILLTV